MIEVIAESFSPKDGKAGVEVHILVRGGDIVAPPGTVHVSEAYVHSLEGASYYSAQTQVIDNRTYTSFAMQIPDAAKPGEHYDLFFALIAMDGRTWEVESPKGEYFFLLDTDLPPVVTSIAPTLVTKHQLPYAMLTIKGKSLDRIDRNRSSQILSSPPINLRFVQGGEQTAQLRVVPGTDINAIRPGNYRLKFFDYLHGSAVFSQATITLVD